MKPPKIPRRHANAIKANDVTEVFVEELQEREAALRSNHAWVLPMLDQMSAGRPITATPKDSGLAIPDEIQLVDVAGHVAVYKLWARRGRVTYDLNEQMAAELYRSTYDTLPGNVFASLPHINPLVVLPDPWPVSLNNIDGLVRGFFIFGYNNEPSQITYTDNEDTDSLAMLFVIDLLDMETGEVRDKTYMRLHVPTTLKEFTFERAAEYSAERVEYKYVGSTKAHKAGTRDLIRQLLRPAVSVLIYLCCDNRDEVPVPVSKPIKRKTRKSPLPGRDPFFVEVGWRVGPKLHAARRMAGTTLAGPGVPTGITRAAHQRSGHFHKYRVGPGRPDQRTETITRWIGPTWVGLGELPEDADPITTVVPVETQQRDPLRRRGLKK